MVGLTAVAVDSAPKPPLPPQEAALLRALQRPEAQVVFYGTSLTRSGGWPEVLGRELAVTHPGLHAVNAAENGKASDWGLANFAERVLTLNPDIVFIEFAVNDAAHRGNRSPEQCRANLEKMLDQLDSRSPECVVVLQIMNPVIDRPAGHAGHRPNLPVYEDVYRTVARERGLLLVDHAPAWAALLAQGEEAFRIYVPDGLHPNLAGYEKFMLPALRQLLGLPQA